MRQKTTIERGKFKKEIHTALYRSKNIRDILLGDVSDKSAGEIRSLFKEHVKSHLFINDTIESTGSFIFYDVVFPVLHAQVKQCNVILYTICHRDILDDETVEIDGYVGNKADVLVEMIEDALVNDEETANSFGIGNLSLESVDIFNDRRFYGYMMTFTVPNFR